MTISAEAAADSSKNVLVRDERYVINILQWIGFIKSVQIDIIKEDSFISN